MTDRRRRRVRPAASAKVLTTGLSVSGGIGLVTALALTAPSGAGEAPAVVEPGTTTPALSPPATIVIRRYVPVPAAANTQGPAPANMPAPSGAPAPAVPAPPATAAPPAAPAPAAPPATVSKGSS